MGCALSGNETTDYCRKIETYLCQKNEGHLIRVVGPSFDLVSSWNTQGVPLKVAFSGIDRFFERYYRKGPRRRPIKIDFCEADVLDAFDEWRRALGVPAPTFEVGEDRQPRAESLPAHLERVVNRLTMMRAAASDDRELDDALDAAVRAIDGARGQARQARGEARAAIVAALAAIDESLVAHLRRRLQPGREAELLREADAELAAFRERMPGDAYDAARSAATDRLLRRSSGLPVIRYEG